MPEWSLPLVVAMKMEQNWGENYTITHVHEIFNNPTTMEFNRKVDSSRGSLNSKVQRKDFDSSVFLWASEKFSIISCCRFSRQPFFLEDSLRGWRVSQGPSAYKRNIVITFFDNCENSQSILFRRLVSEIAFHGRGDSATRAQQTLSDMDRAVVVRGERNIFSPKPNDT